MEIRKVKAVLNGFNNEQQILLIRNLLENSSDIIIVVSSDGTILDVSRTALRYYHATIEQIKDKNYFSFCKTHDYLPIISEEYMKSPHYSVGIKNEIVSSEGIFTAIPLQNEDKIFAVLLMGIDTNIPLLSDKLEQTKTYFQGVINSLPGSIYWKDRNSVYLGCNTYVAQMTGLNTTEEIIGKTDYDFSWKEFADDWVCHDQEVINTGKPIITEEYVRLSTGEKIVELTHKLPLKDRQGNIIGIIGTSLDITGKKKLEEDLRRANQIAEAAERKAQQANIGKSNYILAADRILRTPLGNALGAAQLLQRYTLPEEMVEPVSIILSSIEEVPPVLKRLRDYVSLIDGVMQVFPPYVARLEDVFKKLITTYKPQIEAKSLAFNFEYSAGLPEWVKGCLSELSDVLRHLLHNAIKYTAKGTVTLMVNQKKLSHDNILLVVTVKDTGQGIKPQTLKCLFNFLDQDSMASGFTKGGLVLSVCAKIIERLQGALKVESKLKEGTVFTLTVPLAIAEAPTYKTILKNSTFGQSPMRLKRAMDSHVRFLVIEDNMISQRVLNLTLTEKYNCTILAAYTLEEAIRCIDESIDMILLDINLPDGTGIDFLRILMQQLGHKAPPVVGITSFVNDDEKDEIFAAGAVEVLEKPVDQNILLDLINACVFEDLSDD